MEIFYKDNNGKSYKSERIYSPNGKMSNLLIAEGVTGVNLRGKLVKINATSITNENSIYLLLTNNSTTVNNSNYIYIVKVLGYK